MHNLQNNSSVSITSIALGAHLFVKLPRPGDSEVTFLVFELSYEGNLRQGTKPNLAPLPKKVAE